MRHQQREVMGDTREDPRTFAWQQYQQSFSPWRQSAPPSQHQIFHHGTDTAQNVQEYQHQYFQGQTRVQNEVQAQVKQEQPMESLAQDAHDLVHPHPHQVQEEPFHHTEASAGKTIDTAVDPKTNESVAESEKSGSESIPKNEDESQTVDKLEKYVDDRYNCDGKLSKVKFLALNNDMKDSKSVRDRVVGIIGEDVLQLFNSAVEELDKDSDEIIGNKNLAFLFYAIRNSTILELGEDRNGLEPLSNLALSVPLLSNLHKFVETNAKLKEALLEKVKMEDFEYYGTVIESCNKTSEEFFLNAATAPRVVLLYHKIRNNILTNMFSQLSGLLEKLQDIIINTENSVDNTYNISITQMKSLLGLPWNQQVIAVEAMNFDLSFLNNFQNFWMTTIIKQIKKKDLKKLTNSSGNGKRSKKSLVENKIKEEDRKVPVLKMKLRENSFPVIYKEEEAEDMVTEKDVKMEPAEDYSEEEYNDEQEELSDSEEGHPSVAEFLEFNINFEKDKEREEEDFDQEEMLDETTGEKKLKKEEQLDIKKEAHEQEELYQQTKKTFTEGGKSFKYVREKYCHTCHQNFNSETDWKTHMFAHIEARPFECHIVGCDKAFSRKDVLKGHIKSHSKERPFVCNFPGCEKTFTRNWYMKVHYETSHLGHKKEEPTVKKAERVLFCEFCEVVKEKAPEMKIHLKEEHPEFECMAGFNGYTVKYRNEKGKEEDNQ